MKEYVLVGGCVARINRKQSVPVVQIQTRYFLAANESSISSEYLGYECDVANPADGKNWSRVCPCLVNVSIPSQPTQIPTNLLVPYSGNATLHSVFIKGKQHNNNMYVTHQAIIIVMIRYWPGITKSHLTSECENFNNLFANALIAAFDLHQEAVESVNVFEMRISGKDLKTARGCD